MKVEKEDVEQAKIRLSHSQARHSRQGETRRSVPYFHGGVVEEVAAVRVEKEDAEQTKVR